MLLYLIPRPHMHTTQDTLGQHIYRGKANPISFAAMILGSWKELLLLMLGTTHYINDSGSWTSLMAYIQQPALATIHCSTDNAAICISLETWTSQLTLAEGHNSLQHRYCCCCCSLDVVEGIHITAHCINDSWFLDVVEGKYMTATFGYYPLYQ